MFYLFKFYDSYAHSKLFSQPTLWKTVIYFCHICSILLAENCPQGIRVSGFSFLSAPTFGLFGLNETVDHQWQVLLAVGNQHVGPYFPVCATASASVWYFPDIEIHLSCLCVILAVKSMMKRLSYSFSLILSCSYMLWTLMSQSIKTVVSLLFWSTKFQTSISWILSFDTYKC